MKLGSKMSVESRAKISEAARRRWEDPAERERAGAASRGRKHTDEAKAKMSVARRGQLPPMGGRTHSAETKAKMSAAHRLRYQDPTEREKTSAASLAAAHRRELHHSWKGDDIGYAAAHLRHQKALPNVCAFADETCSGPLQCALNHDTPEEFVKIEPRMGSSYSPRPEDYQRLCQSHHQRYDNGE